MARPALRPRATYSCGTQFTTTHSFSVKSTIYAICACHIGFFLRVIKDHIIFPYLEFLKDDILQMGAEMYTYLSFCPPIKLVEFYEKLLLEGQTKDIVLGLTNMIKTRRNAERSSAIMVWEKFEKQLKHLKYQKIYSVFHNEKSSEYQEKCDKQNCLDDLEILGFIETFYYSP